MADNIRYVVTVVGRCGRQLFDPMQGRYTYATEKEARDRLNTFLAAGDLPKILTQKAIDSLDVRPCECWPGHNDPKGMYF